MHFTLTNILSSTHAAQPESSMTTRKSSRSNSTNSSKPLFPNCCFVCRKTHIHQNKKDFVAKDPYNIGRSYKKGSI